MINRWKAWITLKKGRGKERVLTIATTGNEGIIPQSCCSGRERVMGDVLISVLSVVSPPIRGGEARECRVGIRSQTSAP